MQRTREILQESVFSALETRSTKGMKESCSAYLPRDRLVSLATAEPLPEEASGSVLFADISGFTPLTEAYEAHLGSRRGGEELTRVLNDVYAELIGEVERQRGSVIGFAGDAITCWFAGDDGARAVATGLAMQAGMDRFKAVPSPAGGTIALGLKAAVTIGQVRRFVVGREDVQRVDVLAGDPVYRVAELEHLAERGEVLVDAAGRAALDGRGQFGEPREADGIQGWPVLQMAVVPRVEPWPELDSLTVPDEQVDAWMIAAIRSRYRSGLGEFFTELRPATTLFMKFEGIDFERDEEAPTKLDGFFRGVQEIITELGGVVHQLTLGDKGSFLYAAFGAPVSHEDDTRRALSATLRLRALADDSPHIAAVKFGVGRGTTRTGAYGGPTRRSYGVLGDQVNLAARLMGKAAPGQILVSDPAAREVRTQFQLRELAPIRVKGKSMPITVYSLEGELERHARRRADQAYALPMVGRASELAAALDCLERARGGRGQAVLLQAEAGLGKGRLAAEIQARAAASGFRIFHG